MIFFSINLLESKFYFIFIIKAKNKNLNLKNLSFHQVETELRYLKLKYGGKYHPIQNKRESTATKLAIIVPYRDREINLNLFLLHLHQFLNRQNAYYAIYLIEPMSHLKFNRALLINIGFIESLKEDDYDCFIFHDVDMLPESNLNIYECNREMPKQMAIAINTYSYS